MRTFTRSLALAAALALVSVAASAQATVSAANAVAWTAPTTAADGSALTGSLALTGYNVYADVAAIPDAPTAAPTATVDGTTNTATVTLTVSNNATIHIRVSACNVGGCGGLSTEATKAVSVPVPGIPTQVTFTIK